MLLEYATLSSSPSEASHKERHDCSVDLDCQLACVSHAHTHRDTHPGLRLQHIGVVVACHMPRLALQSSSLGCCACNTRSPDNVYSVVGTQAVAVICIVMPWSSLCTCVDSTIGLYTLCNTNSHAQIFCNGSVLQGAC